MPVLKYKNKQGNFVPVPTYNITNNYTYAADVLPVGSIVEWLSDIIPNDWLLCNGQEVNRIQYQELFELLGTTYGIGNGSTTFNLPNIKGRTLVGKDTDDNDFNQLGKTIGEKAHQLTLGEIPKHDGHMYGNFDTSGWVDRKGDSNSYYLNMNSATGYDKYPDRPYKIVSGNEIVMQGYTKGEGQSHNNIQPSIVCNFIIKVKNKAPIISKVNAIVEDTLNSTSIINALSANQGNILKSMSVPMGGKTGQVLKKTSNADHALEWGDAADPNAIIGDGSITKIIELTYEEYKTLENNGELKENTEYHINNMNNTAETNILASQVAMNNGDNVENSINALSERITNLDTYTVEAKYLGQNPNIDNLRFTSGCYGLYDCASVPQHLGIGVLEVVRYSNDWVLQRYTSISADSHMWERCYHSGTTWTSWVQRY